MKRILQDYLVILQNSTPSITKEANRQRRKEIWLWKKREYPEMPSLSEILDFLSEHRDVDYPALFFEKTVFPLIRSGMEKGDNEALRFIFDCCELLDMKPAQTREIVFALCHDGEECVISPYEFTKRAAEANPNSDLIHRVLFEIVGNNLNFAVHELPFGVLEDDESDYWEMLNTYKELVKYFEREEMDAKHISFYERIFAAWDDYLAHRIEYKSFEDYLTGNHIDYE